MQFVVILFLLFWARQRMDTHARTDPNPPVVHTTVSPARNVSDFITRSAADPHNRVTRELGVRYSEQIYPENEASFFANGRVLREAVSATGRLR